MKMDDESTINAASLLWEMMQENSQIDVLPEHCRPKTLDEGYAIQSQLENLTGLTVSGYKVGATNANVQKGFGINSPFFGRLYDNFIYSNKAFIHRGLVNSYAIEPEFDFIIGKTLSPRHTPFTELEVADAIDTVLPAIEIPDSRYKDWFKVKAPDLVADNAISGLLVMGVPEPSLSRDDFISHHVEVQINGNTVAHGLGSNVLGGPWKVLTWLANKLNSQGMTLNAGSIITTGSASDVIYCGAGDAVKCDFGTLGCVSLEFE
ncbi:MAG: hypothetical protein CMM30_07175 [Rhodospirillaceae bacterium]|nr:hypothetical protein [Rhodospirillaceae bacterium]